MDKVTRLLFLYSKLLKGEEGNKLMFCMETDILPRTFDRDIEDIRLYLSEFFCVEELIYNRKENTYYLSKSQHKPLETMEYLFIKQILLDTGTLRYDEMDGILSHLSQNTENANGTLFSTKESLKSYKEPINKIPLLKINGDLQTVIKNNSVIEINYIKMGGTMIDITVIPCMVKYDSGYFYLIAYRHNKDDKYPAYFRMDRIHFFLSQDNKQKKKCHLSKITIPSMLLV